MFQSLASRVWLSDVRLQDNPTVSILLKRLHYLPDHHPLQEGTLYMDNNTPYIMDQDNRRWEWEGHNLVPCGINHVVNYAK